MLYKKLLSLLALVLVLSSCTMDAPDWATAGQKKSSQQLKIGLAISTLNNPFFVALRDGVAAAAVQESIELKVADAQNDPARQNNDIY